jgi:phosphonate transport system substrate-binding protein
MRPTFRPNIRPPVILWCAITKFALLLALTTSVCFAQAQAPVEINFGVISTESSLNQRKNWEPFLQAMSEATGLKAKGFYATDYAGVIEAMRFNKIQIAWFGNKAGMEAVDRANGEVVAQVVARDGRTGYYSHVIVHANSPYVTIDDILKCDRSIDFSIGDPNSTSGFLVPVAYIFAPRNIDPKACFKTLRNASHQANAMAVANRQVAAATNNSEDLQRLETTAPEARRNIRIIWTSPVIPLDPLVWRKDLAPAVKTRIYTFLMSYGRLGTPEEISTARAVLANLVWSPFNPSSNTQLLPTRKLEANKNLMRVQSDNQLSPDERARAVAAIRAEFDRLETAETLAANDSLRSQIAAFIAADKAGDKEAIRQMIAQFAASLTRTQ